MAKAISLRKMRLQLGARFIMAVLVYVVLSQFITVEETLAATVLVTLNQVQRQGVFQTGSVMVPIDLPPGEVRITANIPTADYIDTTNSLRLSIYFFNTVTSTWQFLAGTYWIGGAYSDPEVGVNPMPRLGLNTESLRGRQIRGELDIPVRMRVGAVVEHLLPSEL